jgi:tetratricopeptide (TPR) repeat protein
MAAARTFLRKYWILIVIVLWVIAWANRDWLAGQAPAGEDAYAEEASVEVPPVVRDVEADEVAAAAEPSPRERPPAEPAPAPEPVAPAPIAPERETAAEAAAEPAAPITAAPVTEPVVEREEAVAPAAVEEPAELLSRARSVSRSRGPGAAAAVMAAGLRELPGDAPERADLYGEMGNYHFTAGNFAAALAAYDSALKALPDEERVAMLRQLAPIYDRYHPAGRSHLDQFR